MSINSKDKLFFQVKNVQTSAAEVSFNRFNFLLLNIFLELAFEGSSNYDD